MPFCSPVSHNNVYIEREYSRICIYFFLDPWFSEAADSLMQYLYKDIWAN